MGELIHIADRRKAHVEPMLVLPIVAMMFGMVLSAAAFQMMTWRLLWDQHDWTLNQ